jgi:hypothetical protein
MSAGSERITRDQIEAQFRELTGEAAVEAEETKTQAITVGLAIGVALIAVVFIIGRRSGRRKSAIVEVRRV